MITEFFFAALEQREVIARRRTRPEALADQNMGRLDESSVPGAGRFTDAAWNAASAKDGGQVEAVLRWIEHADIGFDQLQAGERGSLDRPQASAGTGAFHGATRRSNTIPGSASAVQSRKKSNQPVCSTIHPVAAFISARGTEARLVKSANCVAV